MVPLVVAGRGGTLTKGLVVQRTFGATRSVEYDAVLLAGCPAPDPDTALDPRVVLLLEECFRHAKAIGAWGAGVDALAAAGISTDDAGVVIGETSEASTNALQELMTSHRVWERFAPAS